MSDEWQEASVRTSQPVVALQGTTPRSCCGRWLHAACRHDGQAVEHCTWSCDVIHHPCSAQSSGGVDNARDPLLHLDPPRAPRLRLPPVLQATARSMLNTRDSLASTDPLTIAKGHKSYWREQNPISKPKDSGRKSAKKKHRRTKSRVHEQKGRDTTPPKGQRANKTKRSMLGNGSCKVCTGTNRKAEYT